MTAPADSHFCTVETTRGKIRGLILDGIRQWKGVPYGAHTGGPHRFRRPRPPAPWSGVRDCFGYGEVSPQLPTSFGHDYASLVSFDLNVALGGMGEDCLRLNIWTPGTDAQARRPVLVSLHGGGFAIGSGNLPMYDGARLAGFGDVVVVSATHRLASFGFLNLSDLDPGGDPAGDWSDAGVAGLLDLVAALEWVRDNIASFGGDPGRVMIFGQSGGGWKVSALLAMPAARGLFQRAAIQSGSLIRHLPRAAGAQMAASLLSKLGVSVARLHNLESVPWTNLLAAQTELGAHLFAPVADGVQVPGDPFGSGPPALSLEVPVIISTTLEDAGFLFDHFQLTETELEALLRASYGERAKDMLPLYRSFFPDKSPYLLHAQIVTDAGFRRFAHLQAERCAAPGRAPVYAYLWEWPSPAFDGKFGAVHAMDVPASLRNDRDVILGGGGRNATRMCDALARAWVEFAKTGAPSHSGIPTWGKFDTEERSTLIVGRDTRLVRDPYAELRRYWVDMPEPMSVLG
jgi:para-nitrobenzyl esterase